MEAQTTLRNLPIGNPELQNAYRATLRGVYGALKSMIKMPKFCYVLEFKLNGTAEEALAQISDKNYTLPFEIEDQQIIRIGINIDSTTRNIGKVNNKTRICLQIRNGANGKTATTTPTGVFPEYLRIRKKHIIRIMF